MYKLIAYCFAAMDALQAAGYPAARNSAEARAEVETLRLLHRQGLPAADAALRLVYDRAESDGII